MSRSWTQRGQLEPISSANTITAASSRLDLSNSIESTPDRTAVSSQLDLSQTLTQQPTKSGQSNNTILSPSSSWTKSTLDLRHIQFIVLLTCFVTGLTDTAMYAAYSTFTHMQTGNTIFIALGASQQNAHPFIWVRSLFSLIAYCLGTYLFSRLHNNILPSATRRITVLLSYLLQFLFTVTAAAIIQSGVVGLYAPTDVDTNPVQQWDSLAPIVLLSLSAGGQVVAARSLGLPEVPTVVVTTMLCELFSDPRLFFLRNGVRNRRAAGYVMMLAGAIVGGWVNKGSGTVQAALWIAGGLKLICVVAVGFWKASVEQQGDEKEGV